MHMPGITLNNSQGPQAAGSRPEVSLTRSQESERPQQGDSSHERKSRFCPFSRLIWLSFCVSFLSQMGPSDWQVGGAATRAAWRCTTGGSGAPSATMAGPC